MLTAYEQKCVFLARHLRDGASRDEADALWEMYQKRQQQAQQERIARFKKQIEDGTYRPEWQERNARILATERARREDENRQDAGVVTPPSAWLFGDGIELPKPISRLLPYAVISFFAGVIGCFWWGLTH